MNTLHDAQTQIRGFLKVLNLIAPDHDGFAESGKVDDYATDWAAVLHKNPWCCVYAEWTDNGEFGFEFRIIGGKSDLLSISFRDSDEEKGWHISGPPFHSDLKDPNDRVFMEQLINEAWPMLRFNKDTYRELPGRERHNPSSPYMMGVIVRIINWFAQLPYPKPSE